jgi:hypothetical protein
MSAYPGIPNQPTDPADRLQPTSTDAGDTEIDHDVEVVGWGVDKESGLKFWEVRGAGWLVGQQYSFGVLPHLILNQIQSK